MNRKTIETLLVAAGGVTKEKIKEIKQAQTYASATLRALHTIDPKDAKDIDMCDVMGRLQRNSRSLAYLLDMAAQVADCMNREFVDLFQAQDNADQELADAKMGRWKEFYYAEQQREYDRKYREKLKAEAEAAAKAEEEKPKETRGRKKSKTLKTED